MSTRSDIAQAAGLAGCSGHQYVVAETKAGTVYPRLERIEYPNPFGGIDHWNVVLLLPQEHAKAEAYAEQKIPALKAALDQVLVVTSVTIQRLELTGIGVLPAAFFNGHREQD